MIASSLEQLRFFFMSALAGLIAGAFYNLLTAVRERGEHVLLSLLTDLLFWAAVGTALISMSFSFNDGGIRGYQILGVACGYMLHYLCLGRITLRLARGIVRIVALLLFPAAFLIRGVILYVKRIFEQMLATKTKIRQNVRRTVSRRKNRKKIQKNYKKML